MAGPRDLLEEYVASGKVMQLATLRDGGAPVVCNLWYAHAFEPDRLLFISRPNREHCANLRADGRIAGAVLAIELDGVGQAVRGVSFTGAGRELPATGIEDAIGLYAGRWPSAANAIDPARLASGEAHHRVYQIDVDSWVLYDEENFRGQPRQPVEAVTLAPGAR
jgi:uncharacterized protein YhbP (UPF0306 family)